MTSTQWNNLSYYGRKLKKNFLIYSRIIDKGDNAQTVFYNLSQGLDAKGEKPLSTNEEERKKEIEKQTAKHKPNVITLDTFLKVGARMESTALAINKMVDTIDTTKRIENIEKLIEQIPVELLAEAKAKIGQ